MGASSSPAAGAGPAEAQRGRAGLHQSPGQSHRKCTPRPRAGPLRLPRRRVSTLLWEAGGQPGHACDRRSARQRSRPPAALGPAVQGGGEEGCPCRTWHAQVPPLLGRVTDAYSTGRDDHSPRYTSERTRLSGHCQKPDTRGASHIGEGSEGGTDLTRTRRGSSKPVSEAAPEQEVSRLLRDSS